MREVVRRYVDPLDAVWLRAAADVGLRVERASDAFASTDGHGRMVLGTPETLDADDCLAQMIFHELCHALVQGPESFAWVDWGLDNETDRDVVREHACLRAQAALLDPLDLRVALGPTTDFRAYYDALPANPLEGDDASVALAKEALARVDTPPWAPHLRRALDATARIVAAVREAGGDVLDGDLPPLWSR
ncbi:MAG: hypothetical protein H6720_17415 [Sandaracinus sp.]|nr:hypothetical protein [Sandaracinus sp.]